MSGTALKEIAQLVGGELHGDGELMIYGVTSIEEAGGGEITFAVPPHLKKAEKSKAAALIVPPGTDFAFSKPTLVVENPRAAFAILLDFFSPPLVIEREISPLASVAKSAKIGMNVAISPFAMVDEDVVIGAGTVVYPNVYIGRGTVIGKDCLIYSGVSIYAGCQIGDRVTLHSGAVIGGDGFGYVTLGKRHRKVPQVGNVVLGDDVDVGCNSCIDCGTTGSTVVGRGTKIDNLVHVGHNDIIGENCFLVAHVGISGSVEIGDNVTFAGQAATVGHIKIGNNCVFAGRAGVIGDVPDNSIYAGFPARPHQEWLREEAMARRLPELLREVKELKKKLLALEEKKQKD